MRKKKMIDGLKKMWGFLPEISITMILSILLSSIVYEIVKGEIHAIPLVSLPVLVVLLAGIIGQFFWKNLVLSFVYSALFGFGSIYMVMAVLSEYHEFPAGDPKGIQLLAVGVVLFGGLAFLSFIMPWKYFRLFIPKREW